MKNLFYSSADKTLFWVAGYTADGNTDEVMKQVEALIKNARIFRRHCKCRGIKVKTRYIQHSSRFKYMRVFYIQNPKRIPTDAYQLNNDWTMEKWIIN